MRWDADARAKWRNFQAKTGSSTNANHAKTHRFGAGTEGGSCATEERGVHLHEAVVPSGLRCGLGIFRLGVRRGLSVDDVAGTPDVPPGACEACRCLEGPPGRSVPLRDQSLAGGTTLEQRLSALCYAALQLKQQDVLFGLRLGTSEITPGEGEEHLHQLLAMLARYRSEEYR